MSQSAASSRLDRFATAARSKPEPFTPDHRAALLSALQYRGQGPDQFSPLTSVRGCLSTAGFRRWEQDAIIVAGLRAGIVTGSGIEGRHGYDAALADASLTMPDGSIIGYLSVRLP